MSLESQKVEEMVILNNSFDELLKTMRAIDFSLDDIANELHVIGDGIRAIAEKVGKQ